MVPYASLFAHNLVLQRVFQTPGNDVAFVRQVPGCETVSYTYGRLQRDIVAMANLLVRRRSAIANSALTITSEEIDENTQRQEEKNNSTRTNHVKASNSLCWLQVSRPCHVRSIFAQGDRVPSCDVLHDTGYYNTAVMCGPGYTFLVCMLASWAVNQLVTPMSVSQVYNDELMYVLDHSGCRTILGETQLLNSKFPSHFDPFRVNCTDEVDVLSSSVHEKVNNVGISHVTACDKNQDNDSGITNKSVTNEKLSNKVNSTFNVDTLIDVKRILNEIAEDEQRYKPNYDKAESKLIQVEVMPSEQGQQNQMINTAEDVMRRMNKLKKTKAERVKNQSVQLSAKQFMQRNKCSQEQSQWSHQQQQQQHNAQNGNKSQVVGQNNEQAWVQRQVQDHHIANAQATKSVLQYDADDMQHSLNDVFRQWHKFPQTRPSVFDDCLMVYTSGTTARPKGAVHSHSSVNNMVRVLQRAWQWNHEDSILSVLPIHHIHGLVNIHFCALASGARCISTTFDNPARIARRIALGDVTLFMAVPTIYTKLIAAIRSQFSPIEQTAFRHACVEHVRLMVSGSAALPVPTLRQFHELSGHVLLERYGMTQLGMALSQPLRPIAERVPGTVGCPLPTVTPYVYEPRFTGNDEEANNDECNTSTAQDSKSKKESAFEQVGALAIASQSLFDRYWNNPVGTRKEMCEDAQGKRYFDTGDTVGVNYPHGNNNPGVFTILGRSSVDIIKSRGYKLSALEIEAELLSRKDLFYEIAVVGCKDELLGEAVVAIVAMQPDAAKERGLQFDHHTLCGIENETLTKQMKGVALTVLAPYKCPARYIFVREIPRNATGKVNKKNLKKLLRLN